MDTFAVEQPLWTITQLKISSLRTGRFTLTPHACHPSMMMLVSLSGDQEQLPRSPSLVPKTLIHQTVTFKEQYHSQAALSILFAVSSCYSRGSSLVCTNYLITIFVLILSCIVPGLDDSDAAAYCMTTDGIGGSPNIDYFVDNGVNVNIDFPTCGYSAEEDSLATA